MHSYSYQIFLFQVKIKTKAVKEGEKLDLSLGADEKWPLPSQRALEKALKMYPKGSDQRWDKISNCVPDKTKVIMNLTKILFSFY